MYDTQKIAQRIKIITKENGGTVGTMLSSLNLGVNIISQLAKGQEMSCINLAKIADYLNVSVDYLLGRTETPQIVGGHSIQTGSVGDNSSNNDTSVKIADTQGQLGEMSSELLKKFNELSFDEKIDVFNYIRNKK